MDRGVWWATVHGVESKTTLWASQVALMVKNAPAVQETWVQFLLLPWRRQWLPTPVFLPGKSHGHRSLVGYSPWGSQRVRHDWATKHIHTKFMQIFFRMFLKVWNPLKCFLVLFVSFGCCNKLPQTRWPNVSEIYSLMVVVARCPKSRAMLPPEALEENFPLSLPTLGGYWHSLGYGHISLSALSSHYLLVCVLNLPMALL